MVYNNLMVQAIDTIDDFLRILRERPDIRDAVRREILTDELLALPGVVAGIAEKQDAHTRMLAEHSAAIARIADTQAEHSAAIARITENQDAHTRMLSEHSAAIARIADRQSDHIRYLTQHTSILNDHTAALTRLTEAQREHSEAIKNLQGDVSSLQGDVKSLQGDVSSLQGDVKSLQGDVSSLQGDVSDLRGSVNRLDGRVGNLSGMVAMLLVERYYGIIAVEMDLDPVRMLDPAEIFRMSRSEVLKSKYDENARKSFGQCDLMIEAIGPDEEECYIAVQVSYTVDHNDIQRAIDHAEMMTYVTGKPAYAAVAGAERAGVTENRLESGAVHWHRLREGMFKSR